MLQLDSRVFCKSLVGLQENLRNSWTFCWEDYDGFTWLSSVEMKSKWNRVLNNKDFEELCIFSKWSFVGQTYCWNLYVKYENNYADYMS